MKRFISYFFLFFLLPGLLGLGWTAFVVVTDWRSYRRALVMPQTATIVVCGDSQTKDGLDPALFPGFFNFSTAATTCDQDLLRLTDLLTRNRGQVKCVLLDVSPLKIGYSTEKPVSELNAGRVHALLYLYHLAEMRREFGSEGTLWRDVVCTRKYNEFRKSILRGKPWRSSMAGGYDPGTKRGFLDPKLRTRALADMKTKAGHVNRHPPATGEEAFFAILKESIGLVRAAGARPIVMTMPLSRPLRDAIDPQRLTAFTAAVRAAAEGAGVHYLDYLAFELPETCWYDANHLNRQGAETFTPHLAADVQRCLQQGRRADEGAEKAGK